MLVSTWRVSSTVVLSECAHIRHYCKVWPPHQDYCGLTFCQKGRAALLLVLLLLPSRADLVGLAPLTFAGA
jgi:hypothetical protein